MLQGSNIVYSATMKVHYKISLVGFLIGAGLGLFAFGLWSHQWAEADEDRADIRLFRSYGTPTQLKLRARVIEMESSRPLPKEDTWKHFIRNLGALSVDEIKEHKINFRFGGRLFEAQSDQDGMIALDVPIDPPIQPGLYPLSAESVSGQEYPSTMSKQPLVIHEPDSQELGIISDIDDTLKVSNITDTLQAAKNLFFQSPFKAPAIPGMATLFQTLDRVVDQQTGDGDFFYISGSPQNFAPQIYAFLDHQGFPKGAVTLKRWGFKDKTNNPLFQSDYKLQALREILKTYPQKPFVCFGDSAEADAEIYKKLQNEFPDQVKVILIHHITADQASHPKYHGVSLYQSAREATRELNRSGLLKNQIPEPQ